VNFILKPIIGFGYQIPCLQISINILTKGNMQEIVTYRFNNKSLTNMLMKSWSWKKYIIKMGMNSKAVFYTIKLQALCNHSYINMYRQIRLIFYTLNNENVANNTCRAKHPITWTVSIFSTIVFSDITNQVNNTKEKKQW
jgi:hypothetical protein